MWQGLRVADLQPYPGIGKIFPIDHQEELIQIIKFDPFKGYALFGPSGCGKSHIMHCLLQEAILTGKEVFFSKMANLLRVMRENEFGRLPEERWGEILDADDLKSRKPGKPLYIFIDEIDKIAITDDVFLKFLELVDFIYENKESAVLNVCSNLSPESFAKVWGEALLRRIEFISTAIVIKAEV
jgi:DNA replication protein DnaC